jgi:hypothetical protein
MSQITSRPLDINLVERLNLALHPIVTSHSIDGLFEFCPRKFEFAHVWLQVPESGTTGFAAEVGTALHEAVQEWSRLALLPGRDRHNQNQMAIDAGLMALLKWWPWTLETVSLRMGKAGAKQRSLGEGIDLFYRIIEDPFWESWELIHIDGFGMSIEVPYRINHVSIGTFPIPYGRAGYLVSQGKMDFILRNRYTGEIRVFDLKTTVKDKRAHEAAFRFSGQGPQYAIVVAHGLGFNWREHGTKVTYLVSNFASADGSEDPSVVLHTYDYDSEYIQDAIDAKHDRLMRMKTYAERRHWPRRTHGCDSFGKPCAYLGVCQRRDEDFIGQWFAFERFHEKGRIYDPIWELEA